MKGVAILGSTGSIGRSTLAVLKRQREHFRLVALTANRNHELLRAQALEWKPAFVGLADPAAAGNGDSRRGPGVLVDAARLPEVDIVVNAVVGSAGLEATLAALRAGKRVALANKETLVMAGELVQQAAREGGGELVPVDSEHSAVLQCLAGSRSPCSRLILTASGGPFRGWSPERMARATLSEALNHPTWRMGPKVTVDSATLANKALEVIEAHHLFGLSYDAIEVVVHPQSVVHAFVEFCDGSVIAQVGFPSMEMPILYALTHPGRLADRGPRRFDPVAAGPLEFSAVPETFRAFAAGVAAGRAGGTAPAVFNAANETAVAEFLAGRIAFGRIAETVERVVGEHTARPSPDLAAIREADGWARRRALEVLG